jgi:hypothetical protein
MMVGVVILGIVLGLVTDTIRLGPSEVVLPPNAMSVTLEFFRIPDGDNVHDHYYLVVTVSNQVIDRSIQPYEAGVTLYMKSSMENVGHYPPIDDYEAPWILSFSIIDRTFTFPAGVVRYGEPTPGTAQWSVQGESLLKSRQIFETHASFVVQVRVPDGSGLSISSVVAVTWYYHSAIQAYPVASRSIETPTLLIPSGPLST